MSITAENELTVRRRLAEYIGTVTEAGYVLPAPMYFNDRADFWSTADPDKKRQIDIEQDPIAAAWVYPLRPKDDPELGSEHSPQLDLTYEIYLFRSYAFTRGDEGEVPDVFGKTVLAAHNLFTKAWIDIKAALQGKRSITGLPDGTFVLAQSTSLVFPGFIENRGPCAFIPNVLGFSVKMQETVQLLEAEC